MGGRSASSGFRAETPAEEYSRRVRGALAKLRAVSDARDAVLDFSAAEDHRRFAETAPRQVQAYMDHVQNAAYSSPRMTESGDVVRTLTPDSGDTGIKTGLRAQVITVYTTAEHAFYRRRLIDKDGITLSESDHRTQRSAEDDGRRAILLEMRRRGIY